LSGPSCAPVVAAFRRTALPLASYYAVTLAVPLANGAAGSGAAFLEHALVVLVVPPMTIALACTVVAMMRAAAALVAFVSPRRSICTPCSGSRWRGSWVQ
jgi:hypothetical protein